MVFEQPDWAGLWRELVEQSERYLAAHADPDRSARYLRRLRSGPRGLAQADRLVDFVASQLTPQSTVLDIGAAAGRWSIRLARQARHVTAIEPSAELCDALRSHAKQAGVQNLTVVSSTWEGCEVDPHDVVLNSHAMYGTADLEGLVRSMEHRARQACVLVMRAVAHDGAMAELCRRVRGHVHDSPNFEIGYNVLLSMGIQADVVFDAQCRYWEDADLEQALRRAKRHLYLAPDDTSWDAQIREVLTGHLRPREGRLQWPAGVRSALMWWTVSPSND